MHVGAVQPELDHRLGTRSRPRRRRTPFPQPGESRRHRGESPARRRRHTAVRHQVGAAGAARVGRGAGSRPRPGDRQPGPTGRGQQGGVGPAGHQGDRQTAFRSAGRGPGDHRHLRLLPRRGTTPVRPNGALGDARQAAVHLPGAGRGRRGHHRGQLPGGGAVVVHGPGVAVRQRDGVEAGRVRRGSCASSRRTGLAGGCAARRAQPGLRRRRSHLPRAGVRPLRRNGEQGRLHRVQRCRLPDRRAVRSPPANPVPGAGREEPDGRRPGRGPGPGGRRGAVLRVGHRRAALHLLGQPHRAQRGEGGVRPPAGRRAAVGTDR